MQNSKNSQQKSDKLPYGFQANSEKKSIEIRAALSLKPHEPMAARLLVEYLDITLKTVSTIEGVTPNLIDDFFCDNFKNSMSAVTLFCPTNDRHLIFHNERHPIVRQESDIFHECAHIILEHEPEQLTEHGGLTILRDYNNQQEAQAIWLGFCLQLPKPALDKYFVKERKSREEIQEMFTASEAAIRFRINKLAMEKYKRNYWNKVGK
jgi:IrrE N-terminal-like domain